ncbi:acetyl-CoA synthetase-like protein [Aspergillus brunneoviolaceus CBS 621.78]|uniref:Acetyl-CoA synthetase-like protein n=1 Tax=Aspergillus brunneoviolaceus CBS 621.78 TaxID=1450534 RepID=A0ACD1GAJ1_9EURO|nr:acetyl-CoA synthetase-like protein [Aspergillus brunneoviolaceus CBS 621.78]RAH46301.1 acetyl-CoA synthetase-like protein [Aspergillus brunneoviolaceus CBS 621.78]
MGPNAGPGNIAMANVLRAAWGLVMAQFSGQPDVVFAANVSGRNAPVAGVSEIIAPTITTVPLRMQTGLDQTQTVADFLREVQEQAVQMMAYEHTGLQGIRSHPALQLRNLLVIQPAAESDTTLDLPGIEALPLAVEDFDSYGLNVECTLGTMIGVQARFDDKVVRPAYMTRVLDQFAHIVAVLCDPSLQRSSLRELDLLSRADHAQIAVWNATVPERVEKCIHELVEEQAQARPTALAVWAWDGQLSYRELTHLASLLAHRLVALGVGPERMVGVSMAKSKWAAVALLATLQAGGVVVPLSVSHPIQRIETILHDAPVSVTLVDGPEHDRLDGQVDCSLLVVDWQLFESLSTTVTPNNEVAFVPPIPPVSVTPGHAAWVIYTSGTTGTPKGAVLEHGTLCTSIRAHGTRYGFGPHTRKLQYAAHTFDGTIEDYFTTWAWGGLSCVPSEEDRLDMRQLTAFMRQTHVNALATTYTVAGLFTPEEAPCLRTLVLGGEPATIEVTNRWRTKVDLFNCYGPSECSIFSSAAGPVQNIDEIHNIGTPIGTRLWVADPQNHDRLCPIGAPGELLIEGPQLARGYLNNAGKTQSQFLVDPVFMARFGLVPGRRVYRSGDIVRQKDDGSFVYVARRDTQVKIRGQRVEIGEIEQQIVRSLAETRFVVTVLLQRGAQGSPVLVAAIEFMSGSRYLSGDEEKERDEEEDVQKHRLRATDNAVPPTEAMQAAFQDLHSALFQVLPTHMVPSAYVPVAHMPRNLSGKLDRRALREQLAAMSAESMQQYLEGRKKVAPATDMERTLQSLWLEALGIERAESVGLQDNFFQLGGDSVAAMHLAALTWQRIKLHLTVADVFRHPRLGDLAQRLTELSLVTTAEQAEEQDPEPLSLWAKASPEAVSEIAARCQVNVDRIEDVYPCTPLQEGFMAVTGRQSAAYISRQVYSLSTAVVDLHRFQAAWETLTQTTPILRTRLMMGPNQQALQVVVQAPIVWRVGTDLATYIAEDREAGMKLDQPLVRYGLVTESSDKTYFVWTAHHSIYDGWTMREIAQRFEQIYNGFEDATSIPSTIPYSRFIRYLTTRDPVETAQYWREQFEGEVVADWPALPQHDYHPRPQSRIQTAVASPAPLSGGILISTILRAAWAIVMTQYSGHNDIVFAASVSGRNAPVRQIQDIAGPTLTTVPVRVSVDKSMTVAQLLQTIQQQATEMIPHEQTGLQQIRKLLPDATSSTALALRNLLVVQPAAESANSPIALPGLEALPTPFEDFGSFGLQVECTLGRQQIDVDVQYDEQVVATAYIQKVVDHFVHLVKELANPDRFQQPLHKLHISPQDEAQILDWNQVVPTCVEQCIHALVYNRVVRQPTACAISAWDGELTYEELSGQAASLAAHLQHDLGVKPERTVGVCMDKSKWAAVAILAVLYAGGVVVPLGVAHPLPRVQVIAKDAAVETVLVDHEQQQRLMSLGLRLLIVDEGFIACHRPLDLAQTTALLQTSTVQPHNMAWIIYTSGSTGTPKGVILEHQALSTSIEAHGAAFNMDETTRTLQFAAHTFDATIQDIITTLWAGGCVCIPSENDRVNRLTEVMSAMRVNCATLTSTVASMLVPNRIASMRTMILVGEPVTAAAVALWSPHATVLNAYGPSECSIHSSCSRPIHDAALASNIGFPLACTWWVVDADNHHSLCPIGAPGELLIEGPNQARGYLNDDEKTRAAFVRDPDFIPRLGLAGRRLYRTGDLVKQNPDGSLIHLGRRDLQVKIRGQRIEVGEIEYQIQRHLAGARTVAVERVQHDGDGEQISLVAVMDFVDETRNDDNGAAATTTTAAATATAATDALQPLPPSERLRARFNELRQTLLRILPVYMVPAAYLPVDQMPSNANNKLDRRAIRALLAQHSLATLQQYIHDDKAEMQALPVTALEKKVHALWLEVFDLPAGVNVSMNDNFFHLGGDSVTAMRMVVVAASHGLQLSVEDIFKSPRLADLAATLAARPLEETLAQDIENPAPFELWDELHAAESTDEREQRLLRIAASVGVSLNQIEDVYPCTPLQEGLMAVTARQPAAYVSRQVYAMGSTVDRSQFQAAWETLSAQVSILRTRILVDGKSPALQVVVRDDIRWQSGTDLEQYLQADRAQGMSLGQPLVRYGFVEEPTGACYFIWTAHHALYDGWTVGALSKRLLDIYRQGRSASSVPYTQFIRYLQHGRPDTVASMHYWREQLEGEVMASWPRRVSDKQPLPQDDFHATIPLPPTQIHGQVTISTVLRAAWALVVAQYSGHGDIAFAATVSGRNAPVRGISDIAGPTITTVPIRTRIDHTRTVADYLDAMQRQATHMIDHEHTGLQGIKALLPTLASTLDTGSLLVIQLAEEKDSQGQLDFPGLETIPLPIEPFNAHALTLECQLGAQELTVDVHYDKQIMASTQVKRVIDYFACLFHRLCNPSTQSQSLAEILAINDADQQQILHWNADVPPRLEKCIHEMVREQVERSPTAIAIHAWDGDMTYREFYEAGARVAHQLVSFGVGPEGIVGVCMEKSKWGAVAMLGIMQAGGAIMPLGISHPLARIDTILDASRARLIIVSPAQAKRLQGLTNLANIQLVTLDHDHFDTLPRCQPAPEMGLTPSNASWAIFTSGSTGVPKGVVIEHGTMSTSLDEQGRWLGLTPATRFLQFASYTFDNVITDTFATTAFGGVVCIPSEEARMNQLTEVIADMEVNTAMLTPTVARHVAPSRVPALKTLILTGEPVRADVVSIWLGHADIYNAYGPTEGSMSTCTRPYPNAHEVSNIGFPLATRLWVTQPMQTHLLSPLGAPGELWIEGPFLARGYLGDPVRTQASFIVDPEFTRRLGLHGRRLYRTGDLVQQNEDGTLIHLGRIDSQIKIRGQRVELGEIEHQILHHLPGVSTVAVEPLTDEDTQRIFLVAAVEFAGDSEYRRGTITPTGLLAPSPALRKAFSKLYGILSQTLPVYMVPAVFVPIAEMSRNLSGKLDRKLLRMMLARLQDNDDNDNDNLRQYRVGDGPKVAPSTEMERRLQALWADGLHLPVDEIGAHDNFFHLGGDSLAAMRMVAASRSRSFKLSVADIFKHPSLSELAEKDDGVEEEEEEEEEGVVPFSLIDTDNPEAFIHEVVSPVCNIRCADEVIDILPTTDFQALTVAGVLTTPAAANCAHFLLDGQGPCDVERLRKSCFDLIRALPILRTAYIFDQSRLLQVVKSAYEPDIPIFHTERTLEAKTAEIINHQLLPAPCLGEPFTQMAIVEEAHSTRHRLLLRVTHAEYDAVSINVIWETLRCLFEGTIPPRSPSFASFYYHQQQCITAQTYDYWTDLLAGSSMPQLGRSTSAIGQYPSTVAHLAPRTVTLASPLSAGVTRPVLVKAAWAITLARVAQSQDVVFADTVSTRGTVDATRMNETGCCVTLLPVRVQLSSPALTARELLQTVREQQIQSFEHGHLGFRDILHDCTDWATSTRFTSALNHITEQTNGTVRMSRQEYTISSFDALDATWTVDVGVTAVSREDGALDLRLAYRADSITQEMASEYVRMLTETLTILVDEPSRTIKEMLSAPVARSGRKGKRSSAPVVQITERISGEDPLVMASYLQIKQRPEWEVVLQRRRGVATGKSRPAASFAQRGGDLLDAVYLASLLGLSDQFDSAQAILVGSRREDEAGLEEGLPSTKAKRLSLRTMWTSARKSYARWFTAGSRQRGQTSLAV